MLADWGEVAQFLHTKRLVLDEPSRRLFLDHLYGDFAAALKLLIKRAQGDYTPDDYALRFPKFENSRDTGLGPWQLFELWVQAVKPAPATVNRWRGVFLQLGTEFAGRSAGSITAEEAQDWTDKLVTTERSEATVRDVWVVAARTVFAWAVKRRNVTAEPVQDGSRLSASQEDLTTTQSLQHGRNSNHPACGAHYHRHNDRKRCSTQMGALALCLHRRSRRRDYAVTGA